MLSDSAQSLASAAVVFQIIAFIAAIVCTVILYRKYLSDSAVYGAKPQKDIGRFIRFEKLWIEKIVKTLFVFSSVYIAFFSAALLLTTLFSAFTGSLKTSSDVGTMFMMLLTIIVVCPIVEVFNRLAFEGMMLFINLVQNSSDIKVMMREGAGSVSAATPQQASPAQPTATVSAEWTCSECGTAGNSGRFCAVCGSPRK